MTDAKEGGADRHDTSHEDSDAEALLGGERLVEHELRQQRCEGGVEAADHLDD